MRGHDNLVNAYHYSAEWSAADEVFIGMVAEIPSLAAHGDTEADAIGEIKLAVSLVLEDMEENGEPVPEPFND